MSIIEIKKEKPRFQRVTSKRQVTLPSAWSKEYGDFDTVIVSKKKHGFFVQPIPTVEDDEEDWETMIDFTEGGKKSGMPAEEFVSLLEKSLEKKNGK